MTDQPAPDQQGMEPKEFFVRLAQPVTFRRNLLESSKSILSILREMYSLQEMREKKKELLNAAKKEMREINLLVQKLEERMPAYSKEDVKKFFPNLDLDKPKPTPEPVAAPAPTPTPVPDKPIDEMDLLTQQLANVEERMSSLPPERKAEPKFIQPKFEPIKEQPRAAPEPPLEVPKYMGRPSAPKQEDGLDDLGKALNELKKKLSNF